MFQFPRLAPHRLLYSPMGNYTLMQLGCPIQKSPDQSALNHSPKLIAVYPRLSSPPTAKVSTECP